MSKAYYYFKQILFYLLLTAYVLLLAKALLFKQVSPLELFSADRSFGRSINLIPFNTISGYLQLNVWISLLNVVGNIVLFIPMGLYLQIIMRNKKLLSCVAIVFAFSLCIEVLQYIFGIGSADIDDIILNTFGGLLGLLFYKILRFLLKSDDKTKTAVTFLYCFVLICFSVCLFFVVNILGYRVRIL